MKSRAHTIIAVVCVVIVAASLFFAWRTRSTARDIENRQAKLAAQNASLKERLVALTPQTNDSITGKTNVSQDSQAERIIEREKWHDALMKRAAERTAQSILQMKQLERNSGYQKIKYAGDRVDIGITYAPFFHMADLTPDQAAKLTEIILQRDTTQSDIWDVKQEHPDQKNDPAWRQLSNEATNDAKTAIQSMLGDDGLAQFTLYERQMVAWNTVQNTAAGFAINDLPMSLEQSLKLAEAISNASTSFQNGKDVLTDDSDIDWNAVDAEAKKILTPEQFELFSLASHR